MKYFHNPRCRKSREGLTLLDNNKIHYEIIEYLKTPLKKEELIQLLTCLNMDPMDLIRKGESVYKEKVKAKNLSNDEIIDVMIAEPKLIERPILLNKNKAIVGRPAENLLKIID